MEEDFWYDLEDEEIDSLFDFTDTDLDWFIDDDSIYWNDEDD